jgi:pimeloyl-ACP methyl ester carboxylesterase
VTAAPFDQVEQEVIGHYAAGDYRAALAVLDRSGPNLPGQWERVAYWRACLLARSGHTEEAVDVLTQAFEAGAWWSPRLLELEADLDPLWEHPAYRPLLEKMEERRRRWRPRVTGLYVGGVGGGWPFLGLHGRNQIFETDAARITGALGEGWEVAVPESSQRIASDGPVWDDAGGCCDQVLAVADALWPDRPFVLGGFSQGGRRALQIGLRHGQRIPAVLAVSPMLLRGSEIAEVIEWLGHPPWPLVAIVAGEEDPATRGVATVVRHLEEEGIETIVELVADSGHRWLEPPRRVLAALATRIAERATQSD